MVNKLDLDSEISEIIAPFDLEYQINDVISGGEGLDFWVVDNHKNLIHLQEKKRG